MEEELIYLDDFFDSLEESGIDTELINVVDYEIDLVESMEGKPTTE